MDFVRRLVPTAIRRRYAVKFGIALLILGLSVGLLGAGATGAITNQVEDRVQEDHASSAEQEAQSLQMWNEQNEHTIGTIARSDVVASDDPAAIQYRFLDWQEHLDADTFDISYVDLNNDTVTASTNEAYRDRATTEIDTVPDEAYSTATENVPWVSDAYLAEGEFGQNTTVITYVQLSAENEDRAIIYTANLEAYANQLQNDDGVTTMVLDGDNEVMIDNTADYSESHGTFGMAYGGDTSLLESARTEGATTRQVAGSSLAFENDAYDFGNDGEYVTSAARIFGTDWVIVTHEPTDQALGFVTTIGRWGGIATIVGVLMIGVVGVVLGRNTAVSIDRLTDKASKMEEGDLDVDLETKRIDNIGRLYEGFDSMRVALGEQIEEAEAAREDAERERERIAEINGQLERTADEYSDVMEAAAAGDLTARMDAETDNEAMAEIAADFNDMLEEIEETVADLNRFATDVATASEQVTASSEEVRSASEQVTESIQEISDGAEQQNQSLQSVTQEMSGLSTTTEEIAASSNEVADIAERTVDTGQEGQEAAHEAITAMDQIETEAEDAVSEIRRLEQEVQQIDELINTISEIARQTNMLALNANIEASRSAGGQDDEGFSVVAKEVKALSEDVAEAADEAEDRLEAIRERTERSANEVEGTSDQIEAAGEQVTEAVEALEEIADLAQETNVGVQEISAATEEQAASTQEVVAMVDDAATISEETTTEAENVAAAAEEQTTALTEVTQSASDLSGQAAELSEALDRFETGIDRERLESDRDSDDDDDPTATERPPEFDAAADAAVDESRSDEQPPASEGDQRGQGITLSTDDSETLESPERTDEQATEPDAEQPTEREAEQPTESFEAESAETEPADDIAQTADAADIEPAPAPDTDALEAESGDQTSITDSGSTSETEPESDIDAEPTPAPAPAALEESDRSDQESAADGETTAGGELAAEEILGIDDDGTTVSEPEADDDETDEPAADVDATDESEDAAADATDPLADDADSVTALEPVEDDESDETGDGDVGSNDAETAATDDDDTDVTDDDTDATDDDVFTFGTTDE
ncbi:methyl-accepting chemotaxis sensory transducer [Haloterrigena turkmenica DSM 5511]|uniref:Methyl-accepting chemotaxis sensory transducer n=1 Tax=Haloterrigena turkmenica (strain ATCC 51198 / DSM 5511 / JCM 9101 / NCIMB 13204 / VKM B-1734 / 4k) TaxID=543526 RepID=D2RPM0_HALTV|nr:methyl-accepting chemotaxis protein [Haloterrigena turkmenica]ADB62172.1 methyl-accepting chemotaxis sensory transducer [Haloterrigena turkmenica DSM 5511]